MTVQIKIQKSGLVSGKSAERYVDMINEQAHTLSICMQMLESGDEACLDDLKAYLTESINKLDRGGMLAELAMRVAFLSQGYEHFSKLAQEAEKAGDN